VILQPFPPPNKHRNMHLGFQGVTLLLKCFKHHHNGIALFVACRFDKGSLRCRQDLCSRTQFFDISVEIDKPLSKPLICLSGDLMRFLKPDTQALKERNYYRSSEHQRFSYIFKPAISCEAVSSSYCLPKISVVSEIPLIWVQVNCGCG